MTGVTIDHLVATTAFIAAILLFVGLFTQTLQAAILYQQNRHVSLKASDLLDNILLSPADWNEPNATLSYFGLQKSGLAGYTLSSFALMRLMSLSGEPTEYPPESGIMYSNISLEAGGYLLIPVSDSIDYETAARLLGVNGSYGFQLSVLPTVSVSIIEVQRSPNLILKVDVNGVGFSLSYASVNYLFFRVYKPDDSDYTSLLIESGSTETDSSGSVLLNFNCSIDNTKDAYFVIVNARLSGLSGVGYYSYETMTEAGGIIPFVESFENGEIILAHSWDVRQYNKSSALHYNATFFSLTEDLELQQASELENSTGLVNYASGTHGKAYNQTQIPTSNPGFLIVTYRTGNEYGVTVMPWGISTLGVSVLFGDNPAGNVWTATDLRQVTVDELAYQAKITCWSLQGYQVWNPAGMK
jgi:hypothetical protein